MSSWICRRCESQNESSSEHCAACDALNPFAMAGRAWSPLSQFGIRHHRIGAFELREPDYNQLIIWSQCLNISAEDLLQELQTAEYNAGRMSSLRDGLRVVRFRIIDGSIKSLTWDMERLPIEDFKWGKGLLIEELAIYDPNAAVGLKSSPTVSGFPSTLTELKALWIDWVKFDRINLASFTKLTEFSCAEDSLIKINLSKNAELKILNLSCDGLSSIVMPKSQRLEIVNVTAKNIPEELHSFKCKNLKELCLMGSFKNLKLSNWPGLIYLAVMGYEQTRLDVSGLSQLKILDCSANNLQTIKFSPSSSLMELDCSGNKFESLDVSGFKHLRKLNCARNSIGVIRLSPALVELDCSCNKLERISIYRLKSLEVLDCSQNAIKYISFLPPLKLTELDCSNNRFEDLDITDFMLLRKLNCSGNLISTIKFPSAAYLSELDCSNNKLKSIDLSRLKYLKKLNYSGNPMHVAPGDLATSSSRP